MYCQLSYLGDCLPGRIRHALDELPETLDGTYERTLQNIKGTNWEFARRLFLCVAVASRPLRVEEPAEFLAFDFKAGPIPKFREDWRVEDPREAVLSTCSTLLAVVEVDDSLVMQFSHFSVKEFLMSTRFGEKHDATSCRYHISMTPAHTFVTQACLGVLLHLDANITRDVLEEFPLAEYAARHWIEHARFEGVSENVEEGMKQLFDPCRSHLAVWIWLHNPIPWVRHKRTKSPSPPLGSPFHYAAFCGLHNIVQFLAVEHPQYMHSRNIGDKSTPLHLALQRGHMEVARLLVEHGADATAQDDQGWTPLHWAVKEGNMDLACLLIENGAKATAQDNDGWTPLHWAMLGGSVNISHFLVKHGADLTAQDSDGLTPLHWAVKEGSVDLTRIFVENGADVAVKDNYGSTPLHWAVLKESVDLTQLLAEHGADPTVQDIHGWTPFYWAVHEGKVNLALLLLRHGPGVTAEGNDSPSPLNWGVRKEVQRLQRFLIKHSENLATRDKDGSTPLHWAVLNGDADVVRLLVEQGADVTTKDNHGWAPLHRAVFNGRLDLACLLIKPGVDLTAQVNNGSTLLHWAVQKGSVDLISILLKHGADKAAKDNDG